MQGFETFNGKERQENFKEREAVEIRFIAEILHSRSHPIEKSRVSPFIISLFSPFNLLPLLPLLPLLANVSILESVEQTIGRLLWIFICTETARISVGMASSSFSGLPPLNPGNRLSFSLPHPSSSFTLSSHFLRICRWISLIMSLNFEHIRNVCTFDWFSLGTSI